MRFLQPTRRGVVAGVMFAACMKASGQGTPIVRDGTTPGSVLGSSSIRIEGGQLSSDGRNLFHNFSRFSLSGSQSAVFQNQSGGIKNVIARVTGSGESIIAGTIRTQLGPTGMERANVFLLNPNGVFFNGNSSINVGALGVSTARTIGFSEGAVVTPGANLGDLSNANGDPVNFGDLDGTGTVRFDNARVMMTGQGDVLIIAKDVEMKNQSRITTDGAQVLIVGAGAGNSVGFNIRERGQLPALGATATGNVRIEGLSQVTTSHAEGGRIVIRGGVLTLVDSNPGDPALHVADAGGSPGVGIDLEAAQKLTLARTQISTGTNLDGEASDIRLRAPVILLNNDAAGSDETAIVTKGSGGAIDIISTTRLEIEGAKITTSVDGGGNGGAIGINAGQLTIRNGLITADVAGAGTGGAICVEAGLMSLEGGRVSAKVAGEGTGGAIGIDAGQLAIKNGLIATGAAGGGSGGAIRIDADQLTLQDGVIASEVSGGGAGGGIGIDAGQLTITDLSAVQSLASGTSAGGDVRATVTGDLTIDGNGATRRDENNRVVPASVGIIANTKGTGPGGKVTVEVGGDLTIRNGGTIDSSTFSKGKAGKIELSARNLLIDGENFDFPTGITAFTLDRSGGEAGNGGDIKLTVPGEIRVLNGGEIDTSSFGSGHAGKIEVGVDEASASIVIDKGKAKRFTGIGSDASGSGNAGEVMVRTQSLSISRGGLISTAVFNRPSEGGGSGGRGGDVNVFANSITLSGMSLMVDDGTSVVANSAIYAGTQAGTSGGGGNVTIKTLGGTPGGAQPTLLLSNGAEIGAGSEGRGAGGTVDVRYAGGLVDLDSRAAISARSGIQGARAGSVTVEAQCVNLRNQSSISSTNAAGLSVAGDADNEKRAGSVILMPGQLRVDGSSLEVSSKGGNAGEVRIEGGGLLDFLDSQVVAEAYGDGGNVTIEGSQALLLNRSKVSANAINGDGGNILIGSAVYLANESQVTASSEFAADGVVEIDPQAVLSGAEGELESAPLDVTDSLQPECTQRLATKAGSFIRAGRGGTGRLPGGYLPSIRLHRTTGQGATGKPQAKRAGS